MLKEISTSLRLVCSVPLNITIAPSPLVRTGMLSYKIYREQNKKERDTNAPTSSAAIHQNIILQPLSPLADGCP
ncbi:uncharacterized protein PHALS_14678 [Plasmopara halstedii]|uniref:Uncharacterized protein n=1 Tax=Plasmopara halstedii TaxID=4781 RepID=A0A0N7L615_PLAHL|nr:uncharacterized protein PHALS_14678 [Plasmopara halstedii]CEG43011.1 hypothetical protein PHALS_14678 [Plasmopara halstedii]|eukprot:XP_024579380.1 hypothetical protein PHALS_14678 [Plasmopara halstedii]